jgi:hypothetical protein
MKCPGLERLSDYLDGRLDTMESAAIQAHLVAGCEVCNADGAWYERVRHIAASDESIAPPPWIIKRALRIFEHPQTQPSLAARVGHLIAALVFDNHERRALAGVRATAADNRQLLYRADAYSIDLQIVELEPERAEVTGQLLREGEMLFESVCHLPLALIRDGQTVRATSTNERGEFTIKPVTCGEYDLRIDTTDADITIVGLSVT